MLLRILMTAVLPLCLFSLSGCGSDEGDVEKSKEASPNEAAPAVVAAPEPEVLKVSLQGDFSVSDVTLRWAAWGGMGGWADATEYIRAELAKSGAFTCTGAVLVRKIGDPGVKNANVLTLLFDTPGGPVKIGMNNTSWFRINLQGPELNPPGGPLTNPEIKRMNEYLVVDESSGNHIVWARWGRSKFGNHWIDAYSITQDLIAKTGRVQNSSRGFPLEHPVKNRDKYLQVLISLGGEVIKIQMWGAYFELSPDDQALINPALASNE